MRKNLQMMNFNLIVSTARSYERQAECELWFNLLAIGDENPIFTQTGNPGLILAQTDCEPRKLVKHLQESVEVHDPNSVNFLQKIYPIDIVVPTEIDLIKQATKDLVAKHPIAKDPNTKFRITIRKRQTRLKTSEIIPVIAECFSNPVSLKEYDWNIQIEIVGEKTGIAILTDQDYFKLVNES